MPCPAYEITSYRGHEACPPCKMTLYRDGEGRIEGEEALSGESEAPFVERETYGSEGSAASGNGVSAAVSFFARFRPRNGLIPNAVSCSLSLPR
jgi:hypothetical protein